MRDQDSTPVPRFRNVRVGEWLAEPGLDRLTRGETTMHLRPQLMDLLVFLARHRGQTVPKEQILREVWARDYVSESALSRCICEIRQALGDDAREPTTIQTVPKRGYRLVCPVEFVPDDGDSPDDPGTGESPDDPDTSESMQQAEAGPPVEDTVAVAAPVTPCPASDVRPWTPSALRSRPRPLARRSPALAVGLLAFGLLAVAASGEFSPTPSPLVEVRNPVLLADVVNTTADSVFDETLKLALAVHLGQAPFLRILPGDHLRAALVRMGRSAEDRVVGTLALEVCRRESAAVLLSGSIAAIGSRFVVGIEATACRSGESIGREMAEADTKEDVLEALGAAALRMRRRLGESVESLSRYDVPLVEATTPSLEALRSLSGGDFNRDHARLEDALADYRRATELDPNFALAWARLGASAQTFGLDDEASTALRRAYALKDRVSEQERFYILAHYYRQVDGDLDRTVETYRQWKRIYPGSPVPPTNLAAVYACFMGRYQEAIDEAREAVHLAPYSSIAASILVVAHLGLGDLAGARQALDEAAARGVNDRLMQGQAMELAFYQGDQAAFQRLASQTDPHTLGSLQAVSMRASAAMASGRLADARDLWREALDEATALGPPVWAAMVRLDWAEAEALLGDPHIARREAAAALEADGGADTRAHAAVVAALAGDPAHAATLAAGLPNSSGPDPVASAARALVAGSRGNPAEALHVIAEASRLERGSVYRLLPLGVRARLELAGGNPTKAAATFRELIGLGAAAATSPWRPYAQLGLARALKAAGDMPGSLAAYDRFLALWTSADADVSLLTSARRERADLARP